MKEGKILSNDGVDNIKINKTALVVGANGVIGTNLIAYLEELPDWKIIGLSRRGGQDTRKTEYISVDLLNADDCQEKLSHLTTITHIFMRLIRISQLGPNWLNPT